MSNRFVYNILCIHLRLAMPAFLRMDSTVRSPNYVGMIV